MSSTKIILVVEDDDGINLLIQQSLKRSGYNTLGVQSGDKAINAIRDNNVDLMLLDYNLPDMSGSELLKRLQRDSMLPPFIVVTAHGSEKVAAEMLKFRARDYLIKGANLTETLGDTVKNVMYQLDLERKVNDTLRSLEMRVKEISILNDLNKELITAHSIEQIADISISKIGEYIAPDATLFFLKANNDLTLNSFRTSSQNFRTIEKPLHHVGECLCGLAASTCEPIFSTDINHDPRCTYEECKKSGFTSFAAFPLNQKSRVLGILGVASVNGRDFREPSHFLETASHSISLALENSLQAISIQRKERALKARIIELQNKIKAIESDSH